MTVETRTCITEIRTVGVPVTGQDHALEFYVGKLGFEKRLDVPNGDGERWIEVAPPGAATTIALVPSSVGCRPASIPAYASRPRTGSQPGGFSVP